MIFSCKDRGKKKKREGAVLRTAKRWHTLYGGKRVVMSTVAAVVSVFKPEPGERLCFLCWESSASRIHRQGWRWRRRRGREKKELGR